MDRRGENKRGHGLYQLANKHNEHWADYFAQRYMPSKKPFSDAERSHVWSVGYRDGMRSALEHLIEIIDEILSKDTSY